MENQELILKEFAKMNMDKGVFSELKKIHNPIYAELSTRLRLPKNEIYHVILKTQPLRWWNSIGMLNLFMKKSSDSIQ